MYVDQNVVLFTLTGYVNTLSTTDEGTDRLTGQGDKIHNKQETRGEDTEMRTTLDLF